MWRIQKKKIIIASKWFSIIFGATLNISSLAPERTTFVSPFFRVYSFDPSLLLNAYSSLCWFFCLSLHSIMCLVACCHVVFLFLSNMPSNKSSLLIFITDIIIPVINITWILVSGYTKQTCIKLYSIATCILKYAYCNTNFKVRGKIKQIFFTYFAGTISKSFKSIPISRGLPVCSIKIQFWW